MTDTSDATRPDEPGAGDDGSGEGSGFSPSSWEIIAGVVLLVAAVIIIVVLTGGDDDGDDAASTPTSQVQAPNGSGSTPGNGGTAPGGGPNGGGANPSTPPVTPLPAGVPAEPLPATLILADSFDRENSDELGAAEGGARWIDQLGVWGIRDDAAAVVEKQEDGIRQITVLDPEEVYLNQGTITVTMRDVQAGAGIVFRYRNNFSYIALIAQPNAKSWRIEQVIGGDSTNLGTVPLVDFDDEVQVTVQLRGLNIDVYVDGEARASARSEELPLAGTVGLIGGGEVDETTRWDGIALSEAEDAESGGGEAPAEEPPADEGDPPADEG